MGTKELIQALSTEVIEGLFADLSNELKHRRNETIFHYKGLQLQLLPITEGCAWQIFSQGDLIANGEVNAKDIAFGVGRKWIEEFTNLPEVLADEHKVA